MNKTRANRPKYSQVDLRLRLIDVAFGSSIARAAIRLATFDILSVCSKLSCKSHDDDDDDDTIIIISFFSFFLCRLASSSRSPFSAAMPAPSSPESSSATLKSASRRTVK